MITPCIKFVKGRGHDTLLFDLASNSNVHALRRAQVRLGSGATNFSPFEGGNCRSRLADKISFSSSFSRFREDENENENEAARRKPIQLRS